MSPPDDQGPPVIAADRLRATLDSLREGIQVLSPEWRYLYVNEAVARHGRRPAQELLGRTMMECYPGIEQSPVFAVLQRCLRDQVAETLENEFQYPDGSRGWFELRIQPCSEGLIVLSLDISERKRLENTLEQGYKLRVLGQMAAGVAHDLKNVLNPIGLNLLLLRRRAGDAGAVTEVAARIEDAIRTGTELIERLRGFSRQEPERAAGPADINQVTDAALDMCLPRIRQHGGIQVRRERGDARPVLVNASELTSAVVNLLINAAEAVDESGTIRVVTGCDDGGWIEIADDGPGMAPDVARRVFEPFFTTKDKGTGLGLAQVYALAQRHNGRLDLDTAPGTGTRLRLWFPFSPDAGGA